MTYSIQFIGGIRDGDILAWDELPPEISFPTVVDWSWMRYKEDDDLPDVPVQTVTYLRVSDTCNYVCKTWNKYAPHHHH